MASKTVLRFLRFQPRIWLWGIVILVGLLITLHLREPALPPPIFGPQIVDPLTQVLGHPSFNDIRLYERERPQHVPPRMLPKGDNRPRLLNTHLAYRAQRAYVFPNYIPRDHPAFPDILPNGTRHMLEGGQRAVGHYRRIILTVSCGGRSQWNGGISSVHPKMS
ncbi:hypothetical protein B0H16DRAFT_1456862 [Mycena metata]|uniref:Uncharacterized protein n=1 Tax=Mycena metata TaxID=1033252 RepID=A0AAD7NGB9_9AGAR|nr:hypothetical protein B0H16DRAFT_1456862 [Mycena metata]